MQTRNRRLYCFLLPARFENSALVHAFYMETGSRGVGNMHMTELKAAAEAYWEQGYVVIPWRYSTNEKKELEKKPDILEWKEWQTRPQTKEEFDSLKLDTADGIGLLCGTQNKAGLYLVALDYDIKPSPNEPPPTEESLELGKTILREMPTTAWEQSQSKGEHLYYLSQSPVKTEKKFKKQTRIEFLGAYNLIYVAPSKGYRKINDNGFTVLTDVQNTFYEILHKHGLTKKKAETSTIKLERKHDSLERILERDNKLADLLKGEYENYNFQSRSEAEQSVLVKLVMEGFNDAEINEAMSQCQLGKWQETGESYKKHSLDNARRKAKEFIDSNRREKEEFEPVVLAKEIMAEYQFIIEEQSRLLFVYDPQEGEYVERAEETIKREMAERLDEETRARYYNDVFFFINATAPIKPLNDTPELILCKNGILNTLTRQIKDFTPKLFLTSKIPTTYNPDAKMPLIEKFLLEVLDEDQIKVLQELIGYTLYRKIIFHKAGLFVGKGRNGKGVTLKLIEALLGSQNCSSETVQDLCYNRFSKANLLLKLANISADLPSSELKHTGTLKMLIAGDTVNAERKMKTAFPFVPFAKHFYSANQIPPISNTEDNDAYYARWVIIEFTRQFLGKAANKHLIEELTIETEMSGFLNWALDGLKRLIEQNDFSVEEDITKTRKEYIKRSDSRRAFIEEMLTVTNNHTDFIFNDELHRAFINYCVEEKLPTHTKGELTKAMQQFCPGAEHTKIRLSKEEQEAGGPASPISAWRYLKFKPKIEQTELQP